MSEVIYKDVEYSVYDELSFEFCTLDQGLVEFSPWNNAISIQVNLFIILFELLFVEFGILVYVSHGMNGEPSEFWLFDPTIFVSIDLLKHFVANFGECFFSDAHYF